MPPRDPTEIIEPWDKYPEDDDEEYNTYYHEDPGWEPDPERDYDEDEDE